LARPSAYLAVVEAAVRAAARGELETPPVGHVAARDGAFHIKAAACRKPSARAAIKVNGNFPANPARNGLPTIQGFIALLDAECGRVLALMDSAEITARRTAAASALAARLLARKTSTRIAFVGCGRQAHAHLDALRDLFPLRALRCCDTSRSSAEAFAARARELRLDAAVASSAAEAVHASDIVVTCTPSTRPLLRPGDVLRGAFIAAVGADAGGKQELDPALLRIARVVPDVLAQAAVMGDLHHALDAGAMTIGDVHAELSAVVAGTAPGRRDDDEIFVFDSTGTAIEDLAAAELVYALALDDPHAQRVTLSA
jgi:ornithine cyclodeaminase/alanine dehydrogenase-like protein (mu-crystallin family)